MNGHLDASLAIDNVTQGQLHHCSRGVAVDYTRQINDSDTVVNENILYGRLLTHFHMRTIFN
jgi:hypothetical protein